MSQSAIEKVRAMSDRELFSFFNGPEIYKDPEMTLAVCQEVENREAARTGRKPAVIVFEDMGKGCLGQADPNGKIILNRLYLDPGMRGVLPPARLLNTLLHEGRHHWQFSLLGNENSGIPESIRLMLQVDSLCYVGGPETTIDVGIRPPEIQTHIEYAMQENEMDARFHAIRRMQEIAKIITPDTAFQIQLRKVQMEEVLNIKMLLKFCSEEQYQQLESFRLKQYHQLAESFQKKGYAVPKLPDNFRCYGNIWMIRHIVSPVMGFLLQKMRPMRRITGEADWMLYRLFEIARVFAMNGKPLEEPQELLHIAIQEGFVEDFGLAEIRPSEKMEKAPGL